jgi:hypothetical protein
VARRRVWPWAASALAYVAIGIASALVSNPIPRREIQATLRLVALALAGIVFLSYLRYELLRQPGSLRQAAGRSAGAVAAGAFLLAVYAVSCALVAESPSTRSLLPALVVWPLVTALLGFLAALALGRAIRRRGQSRADVSDSA